MSEPGGQTVDVGSSSSDAAVTISSQLMIAAVIFLFMVVVFIFFLYLYAKHYMGAHPSLRRSRGRFIFSTSVRIPVPRRGLDPEVLKSLPVTIFRANDFKEGLECAVCLSELSEGEEARLLPKCNHGFHVECIDMWFHSHTTCPLCRAPVGPEPIGIHNSDIEPAESHHLEAVSGDGHPREFPNFPANVLFWGTEGHVSSRGPQEGSSSSSSNPLGGSSSGKKPEGMLVIDIPRRVVEGFSSSLSPSPLPTSRFPVEDLKSPIEEMKSPMSAKFKSLRRLLSRGKRVIGSSCSPRGGDIEQGIVGAASGEGSNLAPKTPTSCK